MSSFSWTKVAFKGLLVTAIGIALSSVSTAENMLGGNSEGSYDSPRMATYDVPSSDTTFALSLSPQMDGVEERASDVVIFVDTSASQSGVFKKDSLATVQHLLKGLSVEDRVKLIAIDLDPVVLTSEFVRPDSKEIAVAIEKLRNRVALGSTDMALMLDSTPMHFADTAKDRNRNAVYIGDGISRAGLLTSTRFEKSVKTLVNQKISVSSFAIGPERNIELLAALANNTGGNIFLDSDDESAMQSGAAGLAETVHGSVFWPQNSQIPSAMVEVYPRAIPPMRSGRDTVVVGTITDRDEMQISIDGSLNGQTQTMNWKIKPEGNNVDFAFLPKLVSIARNDDGMTLPTVGSQGLREMAITISADAGRLADLSTQALATGNATRAKQLASAALASDPNNTKAEYLSAAASYAVQDDDPFGDDAPAEDMPQEEDDPFGDDGDDAADDQEEEDGFEPIDEQEPMEEPADDAVVVPPTPQEVEIEPGQAQPGNSAPIIESSDDTLRMFNADPASADEIDRLLQQTTSESANLIDSEANLRKVRTQKMTAQVQFELTRAREELAFAPGDAIDRLKSTLDILQQTTDIDVNRKQDLRARLQSALMSARGRKFEFDDLTNLNNQRDAVRRERMETVLEYERTEAEISRLINQFDSLLDEGKFAEAEEVTLEAFQVDSTRAETVQAYDSARVRNAFEQQRDFRRKRDVGFLAAMLEVERASTPFAANPPLVFPDAVEWARKKALREKYSDVRLTGSENDERILKALDKSVSFDYDNDPFEDVMEQLRTDYGINVYLDQSAVDDALTSDEPITFNVKGIRLKNALRLMLKEKNATYIVRDEVLLIISLDVASDPEFFVTNIYNVGDLVAPRQSFGGGGGFGGGGQGGGGFGGGGQGAGGGGFGGGGRGGGGVFCIVDSLDEGKASEGETAKKPARKAPRMLTVSEAENTAEGWDQYFTENFAAPADVRYTVRRLMKKEKPQQVIDVIQGALKNKQSQAWMYEALVIAMRIADYSQADIERALMSAVDLSDQENDAMVAAQYMLNNGMEKRAIRLLQDLSETNSTRPEPFVLGLRAAQRINDLEGVRWATLGILSQAWPKHRHVVKKAIFASEAIQKQLQKEGRTDELAQYKKDLDEALYRDVIIKVTWSGDADLDIMVQEPGGTLCSRHNPRTTAGGILMGDAFSNSEKQGETSEFYVLPKGFGGDYKLIIRKIWGEITAGKATVSIYNHFRSENERSEQKQLEVDENGTLVLFTLDKGRLKKPLEDHAIKVMEDKQLVMNRVFLAQQLEDSRSATAASDYYGDEGYQNDGPQLPVGQQQQGRGLFAPRAAGYRPEITQLQEGTFMTVNHATTADRLYVMVSASPFINQITRVDTFNILGSAQNAGGAGGGIGGVGGGGGGIGGAGGGGGIGGGGLF